jgi:hypothetical protein
MLRIGDKLYVGNFGDGFINIYKLSYDCDCDKMTAVYCDQVFNECRQWGIAQKRYHQKESTIWFAAGI